MLDCLCSYSVLIGILIKYNYSVTTTAHKVTEIQVPTYGDPRYPVVLVCKYEFDKKDPPLHSVKWYRGKHEIFRYIPAEVPSHLTFQTPMSEGTTGNCNLSICIISVKLPKKYNTRYDFRCDVSTERPRFEIQNAMKTLTVAVVLKEDPMISGLPATVQLGEDVLVNCTTGPAMPPANIMWLINGTPERTEFWLVNNTQVSTADEDGLRSSWRALRFTVTTTKDSIELLCKATQPIWPPYIRTANATTSVANSANRSWFTSSGESFQTKVMLAVAVLGKTFFV